MWEWLEWIKHGFLKGCSRERERGKKLCLVTETCCVAIVGDNVLIEPQTVWFFRPEVSFKQAREKEMYLSGAPLAASPWLHCSNVNGGLGAVCRDPLNSYPATAPSFSFPLRQLVSFRGSWPSDWCVIAPSLTCPLTALFIGQAASAAFYWALCFQGSGWRAFSLAFSLSLCFSLSPFLPSQPSIHYDFSPPQCHYFTLTHFFWLTQFVQLQIALLSASKYSYWCATH